MKRVAVCFSAFVLANARTMEECIAQIPADSAVVCEYANTDGDVCWMRNDSATRDLIFQCETKQWTALSCGSNLVSTCPKYDEAGECLFVNCSGMTCKLTSPGRYGSKHLSCDKSNLEIETTTTTSIPTEERFSQDINIGREGTSTQPSCENLVWAQSKTACKNQVNSNSFGKCQYVVLPANVVNNDQLTICVWQCCGDDNFAQCTTECETRLLSTDRGNSDDEREVSRRDMNNDQTDSEEESVSPNRDTSNWGLSRGAEDIVDGFAVTQQQNKLKQSTKVIAEATPQLSQINDFKTTHSHTDIAIAAPQNAETQLSRKN